ncbi:hypothetical protein EVA_09241, partial [gut metagenome]
KIRAYEIKSHDTSIPSAARFNVGTDSGSNQPSKTIELQKKVLHLCGKLPLPHRDIGMYTINMGRLYYLTNDPDKAAK